MAIKKIIFILFLIIALCAAKFAYDKHYGPKIAEARQQEEAQKLAQLKADLYRAAASGRSNTSFPTNSEFDKLKKSSRTGST